MWHVVSSTMQGHEAVGHHVLEALGGVPMRGRSVLYIVYGIEQRRLVGILVEVELVVSTITEGNQAHSRALGCYVVVIYSGFDEVELHSEVIGSYI